MPETDTPRFGRVTSEEGDKLLALITAFHAESDRELEPAQVEAVRALLADERLGRAWICGLGDRDCGYGLAYFRHSLDHSGTIAVLDDLYVVPDMRSRGIGGAMLQAIEADLAGSGIRAVTLEFDPEDEGSSRFYRDAGYSPSKLRTAEKTLASGPKRD